PAVCLLFVSAGGVDFVANAKNPRLRWRSTVLSSSRSWAAVAAARVGWRAGWTNIFADAPFASRWTIFTRIVRICHWPEEHGLILMLRERLIGRRFAKCFALSRQASAPGVRNTILRRTRARRKRDGLRRKKSSWPMGSGCCIRRQCDVSLI